MFNMCCPFIKFLTVYEVLMIILGFGGPDHKNTVLRVLNMH